MVMSGPDATAGSAPKRQRMMGIALPVSPETVIEIVLETPMQNAAEAEKSEEYYKIGQR